MRRNFKRANWPKADAEGGLTGDPPGALCKVGIFGAPVVVVALAAGGAAAAGGVVLKATAFDDPRVKLFRPVDRVAPADDSFVLQPLVAVLRIFIDDPFGDVAVHVEQAPGVRLLFADEVHSLAGVI